MKVDFGPIEKPSLVDGLVDRIVQLIRSNAYEPGDRLPAIMEMARSFGVGHPSVREALKKLETVGIVEIKHGSGVYVGRGQDALLVSNPVYGGGVSKKLMLDLIEARMPIETKAATLAAVHATEEHLEKMAEHLRTAGQNLQNDAVLSAVNMAFHREIAVASGNTVLEQLQEVLTNLFQREQRVILGIYGSRDKDHEEHRRILEALRSRDAERARTLMEQHLAGVRDVLLRWDPADTPLS